MFFYGLKSRNRQTAGYGSGVSFGEKKKRKILLSLVYDKSDTFALFKRIPCLHGFADADSKSFDWSTGLLLFTPVPDDATLSHSTRPRPCCMQWIYDGYLHQEHKKKNFYPSYDTSVFAVKVPRLDF